MVKNPPAMQKTWVRYLGWEDSLEEGMATHSSILARRIPMDRGALSGYGPWGRKESDTTEWTKHSICDINITDISLMGYSLRTTKILNCSK